MAATIATFGSQLKHFAQSVDTVDRDTFDKVRTLALKYIKKELKAEFFELLYKEPVRNGTSVPRLRGFWASDDAKIHNMWPVTANGGTYTNIVTQSFDTRKPMWIVNKLNVEDKNSTARNEGKRDKRTLTQCSTEDYIDLWSSTRDIPHYAVSSSSTSVYTLIVVPMYNHRHDFGVYYIECSKYIEPTDVAKNELERLGDALRILYSVFEVTTDQQVCKRQAIEDLTELLDKAKFPKLAKPHFFVSYSSRAPAEIRIIINAVLNEYADRVETTDWAEINQSGAILAQITREICESRYGICYLSEPAEVQDKHGHRFVDNANVLFEAGMLHARTAMSTTDNVDQPAGWIPIREEDSPPAPFDFSGERMIRVPRTANGQLVESEFQRQLRGRIDAFLTEKDEVGG